VVVLASAALIIGFQVPDAREAYSAAAALLRQDGFSMASRIRYGQVTDLPQKLPPGLYASMTPLEAIRWQSKTVGEVLVFVEKGNNLPYAPPPPPTIDSVGGDFAVNVGTRSIAKSVVDYAWLKLSEGKSSEAVRALMAIDTMSCRFNDESVIAYLVATAIDSILLSLVNDFLSVFTISDWDRLERLATRRIADTGLIARVYESEFRFSSVFDAEMRKELPDAGLLQNVEEEDDKQYKDPVTVSYFKALTMPRWQAIVDRLVHLRQLKLAAIKQGLNRPEAEWTTRYNEDESEIPKVIRSDSDVVRGLSDLFSLSPLDVPIFRSRAQFRLLLLHGKINRFRWNHLRYPDALTDVATDTEAFDPLSRKAFVYKRLDSGYKLVSSGREGLIGEVALKYRRPPGAATDREDGPP